MMNKEEIRKTLCIDEYLELVKECPSCKEAYVSFGQYIDILQQRITKAIELLKQPTPSYASCIKLLDELEEILGGKE